jgi:hypothetical protein
VVRRRGAQVAYLAALLLGATMVWLAPRPPMEDFPQHVAQVTLLRDLLRGTSPWSDLLRINWFTPYLLGYGVTLLLSAAMPVTVAMKVVLSGAFLSFVASCTALRKAYGGDARLDWLYIPGFFGFAYQFGLVTFLVAAPLGWTFVLLASRAAARPTLATLLTVTGAGVALFFCHGLVFLFCCAVGVTQVLLLRRSPARTAASMAPYVGLGCLAIVYFLTVQRGDPLAASSTGQLGRDAFKPAVGWDWSGERGWHRLISMFFYVLSSERSDAILLPVLLFMAAAPWLLGLRVNREDRSVWAPTLVLVGVWLLAPEYAMKIHFLYHRFALFLLPAYALLFSSPRRDEGEADPVRARRSTWVEAGLAAACIAYLGIIAVRHRRFIGEAAPFEKVLAAAEPGQRAMSIIFETGSTAIRNLYTFQSFPVWYENDKGGFVDFNYAYFLPQIVRFRPDRVPPMPFGYIADLFDWKRFRGRDYRYFFVRRFEPSEHLFDNDECRVVLLEHADDWWLYERKECR